MIVIGLDLSMASTGVARIADGTVQLTRVQSKPTDSSINARSTRLRTIAMQVTALCAGADLVIVEGPSFGSTGAGTWDRAGLWWLIVARLTGTGLRVADVPPSNVKMYALGKGGGKDAGKDNVLAAVIHRYQDLVQVTGNDVADALILAAMGARHLGHPIENDIPATHLRALSGVRWNL